tara:strand:+ start:117 stop:584 length:468 start_codon:yes stop_codon:yes gene_type:complete
MQRNLIILTTTIILIITGVYYYFNIYNNKEQIPLQIEEVSIEDNTALYIQKINEFCDLILGNEKWDQDEEYTDTNNNKKFDKGEPFIDSSLNTTEKSENKLEKLKNLNTEIQSLYNKINKDNADLKATYFRFYTSIIYLLKYIDDDQYLKKIGFI